MFHHKMNVTQTSKTSKNVSHNTAKLPVFLLICFLFVLSACEKQSIDIVRVILAFGGSVNQRCHHGWTALHEAVRQGSTQLCELLLQSGAAINATNIYGITPLIEAARHGKTKIVNYLISKGRPA